MNTEIPNGFIEVVVKGTRYIARHKGIPGWKGIEAYDWIDGYGWDKIRVRRPETLRTIYSTGKF